MVRRILFAVVIGIGLVLAACSAPAGQSPSPGAGSGVRQIQVTMADDLRMQPDRIQVAAGETVEFVVRNQGKIRHEFFLGDEAAQSAHETEMQQMGGMAQDEANGIFVEAGQSKTLRHTFSGPGSIIAGCHEVGHYAAGMKAQISVQ